MKPKAPTTRRLFYLVVFWTDALPIFFGEAEEETLSSAWRPGGLATLAHACTKLQPDAESRVGANVLPSVRRKHPARVNGARIQTSKTTSLLKLCQHFPWHTPHAPLRSRGEIGCRFSVAPPSPSHFGVGLAGCAV